MRVTGWGKRCPEKRVLLSIHAIHVRLGTCTGRYVIIHKVRAVLPQIYRI
jgi:hypothetical protein